MALGYFRFALNYWLVLLAGMLVLFVGAGFALDWFGGKVGKESEDGRNAADGISLRRFCEIIICARMLGCVCLCVVIIFM